MSIESIFSDLSTNMLKGIMIHEQLMNCYLFLGLEGYAACHEYHYVSETNDRNRLLAYLLEHTSKLVNASGFETPEVIPRSWYGIIREELDHETRVKAIMAAYDEWINWEERAKSLYEKAYKELLDGGDIAFAEFIKDYIVHVEEEIVYARSERLKKIAIDYDMVFIMEEQDEFKKRYKKKLHKIW